jgi:hypothetical protein
VQSNVAGTLTLNAGQTASTVNGSGALVLKSSTGADLSFTGKADTLAALKLTTSLGAGNVTVGAARTTSAATLGNLIQDGSTLNVNGKTSRSRMPRRRRGGGCGRPASAATSSTMATATRRSSTDGDHRRRAVGHRSATGVRTNQRQRHRDGGNRLRPDQLLDQLSGAPNPTGTNADLSIVGTATRLRSASPETPNGYQLPRVAPRRPAASPARLTPPPQRLAVNVTFGDGSNGTVKTLDQLNARFWPTWPRRSTRPAS